MKYFVIAGERSGDQHASKLVAAILKNEHNAKIIGWGGKSLQDIGVKILKDYTEFSVMGFWEVFKQLGRLNTLLNDCKRDLLYHKPDKLILVDFGGFNLRIAKFAYENSIPVFYYIPPKTWAWNGSRNRKLAKYCQSVLCILPFEEPYFRKSGVNAFYVGNPTLEKLSKYQRESEQTHSIGFFPGSRVQEIRKTMPVLNEIARNSKYSFQVAAISALNPELYDSNGLTNVELVFDRPDEVLFNSQCAVITSGTASLEASVVGVPHVVIYKTNVLSYWLASLMIKVKYISLVNLILNRRVVSELIQHEAKSVRILEVLRNLIEDEVQTESMKEEFRKLRKELGTKKASEEAARIIIEN